MSPSWRGCACLAVLTAALAGCAPARPRRLVVALPAGPVSLEPNGPNEEFTLAVLANVYETLVELGPGLDVRPGLAEAWWSVDELTWAFRLREGVRLHDGRALRARDVLLSLEHARTSPASRRRLQLERVEQMQVSDDRTLLIRTRAPFDPLPMRLSNVHVWGQAADGRPLGTGPYRVTAWSAGGDTTLEAVAGHRLGRPPFAQVEFRSLPSAAERVRQLQAGQVDLVVDPAVEALPALRQDGRFAVLAENGLRVLLLAFDVAREHGPDAPARGNPFRDRRVREAVALAVDRAALVRGPLGGQAAPIAQLVTPQEVGGHLPRLQPRAHDPAAARALLAEAGWSEGFEVPLDFMPAKYRAMEGVVAAIGRDLAQVGIRVRPRPGGVAEVLGRIERRDTPFYLLGWISDTGDGRLTYEYLLHSPGPSLGLNNGGGYSNPEMDRLIALVSTRLPPRARDDALSELALLVQADVPVVPLYRQLDLYALRRDLLFKPRLDRRLRAAEIAPSPR